MTEDKKTPETIEDKDLDQAKGGYSVWIGGSLKGDTDGDGRLLDRSATEAGAMDKAELLGKK